MPNETPPWNTVRHLPLERLSPTVWRVEGEVPGLALRRVMTIVRRRDGSLVVHSPIATDEATTAAIDALGPIGAIVVPSELHRLDAPAFSHRYPAAKVYAPSGGREKIALKVRVDATLDAFPADAHLRFESIRGVRDKELAMVVCDPRETTLVVNDVVFDMPHVHGFIGWALRHVTRSSGGPRVTRLFRWAVIDDVEALRASLRTLAELPDLVRIVVAHHRVIDRDAAETLRSVADAL